ncbi:hypothetical protein JTB14_036994 [Gonioctena quinquepunctata]|nr:hypothetical protein JTB14_036994 [Gonioctena quinquepunctata]
MSRSLIIVASVLISFHFVVGFPLTGEFELREGDCSNVVVGDVVYENNIDLAAEQFVSRSKHVKWSGDETIYCVLALTSNNASEGSTVAITAGGVGYNNVTLKLQSKTNHGLQYNVTVYGKTE